MAEEVVEDTGDEQKVKIKKTAHELRRDRELEETRKLLQTYGGRAFVWRLLSVCGVYNQAPGSSDDIARFEGKRDIGLHILNEVFTSDPNAYTIMRNEASERQETLEGKK